MTVRNPSVQGRFYADTKSRILSFIEEIENRGRYEPKNIQFTRIIGGILPHAGHIYSGYQTVPFFQFLKNHNIVPETFVIVHPNHSGYGHPVSLDVHSTWRNAIGSIEIDEDFADYVNLPGNKMAHEFEHSCEVIVPFIQYYFKEEQVKLLPICMLDQGYDTAKGLGEKIFKAAELSGRNIILIASSDFSHFMSVTDGYEADELVLNEIKAKHTEGVFKTVKKNRISVCGSGPIMTLMAYAGLVSGAYEMEILARGHSGEVMPSSEVVDYISMIFYH